MELKVSFAAGGMKVIYIDAKHVGLKEVDAARNEIGIENLDIEVFDRMISRFHRECVDIYLSEEDARSSNLFADHSSVYVECAEQMLSKFAYPVRNFDMDKTTGAITRVHTSYEIDERAILEAWADAGYPLEWG